MQLVICFKGSSTRDSGERQAFHLTSNVFTPGSVNFINESSDEVAASLTLQGHREGKVAKKIGEYTLRVFETVLSRFSS